MTVDVSLSSDSNKLYATNNGWTTPISLVELMRPEARQFLKDLIIGIPDSLFYELARKRLNIPLQQCQTSVQLQPGDEEREYYTLECLVDTLFLEIAAIRNTIVAVDGRCVTIRKYYNLALRLWRWIPIAKPVPEYVLNISDLTPRIVTELKVLDEFDYNYVTKQAVGRIFENIHPKQYHMNIARRLKVRLDR